jgi:GPH family glycoside/pentoside/hexuronide:cation symporter
MRDPRTTVSTSLKLRYAMGGTAEGATSWAFNGFNFVIYTIIFGMPGTLVGPAVFLSIILDAVSDPLIGYLSDRWRSRWGRRHSFIYFAALPLGASVFCIYAPPELLLEHGDQLWSILGYQASPQQWALALWLFIFSSLLKFFLTCYHLPHLALGSELTNDYMERTRIFRYNTLFSFSGGASLSFLFYRFFFTEGPQANLDTTLFAASVAIFGSSVIFLTAFLTREQIPLLVQAPENLPKITARDFLQEASVVFHNRNYMMLFYGLLCLSSMVGVRETLSANMGLFYWELKPAQLSLLPFFTIISYFIAATLVAPMNNRFSKGGTMRVAVATAALAASLPILFRSLNLLPGNDSSLIFFIVGVSAFAYYGSLSILTTSVYSAIADVVDEQELVTGRRQEGIFYAVRTFFAKMANGIGHLLAGIAIDIIGFPPKAVVGEVDPQVIFELGLFEGVIAVLPVLGSIYFYGKYQIDKNRHRDIREQLAQAMTNVS